MRQMRIQQLRQFVAYLEITRRCDQQQISVTATSTPVSKRVRRDLSGFTRDPSAVGSRRAPQGDDDPWGNFPAQVMDMHLKGVGLDLLAPGIEALHQAVPGQHPPRLARQLEQQREFLRGEIEDATPVAGPMGSRVYSQRTDFQYRTRLPALRRISARRRAASSARSQGLTR